MRSSKKSPERGYTDSLEANPVPEEKHSAHNLTDQKELAGLDERAGFESIQIYATCEIPAIKHSLISARLERPVYKDLNLPTENIIDCEPHLCSIRNVVPNSRCWVEGVRVVLAKAELCRQPRKRLVH